MRHSLQCSELWAKWMDSGVGGEEESHVADQAAFIEALLESEQATQFAPKAAPQAQPEAAALQEKARRPPKSSALNVCPSAVRFCSATLAAVGQFVLDDWLANMAP